MRVAQKSIEKLLMIFLLLALPFGSLAQEDQSQEEAGKFDPKELINGHVWDSHEFHVMDWNGEPITFALPVILWTDNGLTVFSSAEFHHNNNGEYVVEKNGNEFVKYKEHIFYADKFDADTFEETSSLARPFMYEARPLDFSITKTVFSMLVACVILLLVFGGSALAYRKNKKAPKGLSGFLEPIILFVRDEIAVPNVGAKNYDRYMPLLLTLFFFILINNLAGLIPFFPFGGNVTGNIVFTFVLAFLVFLVTVFSAKKNYWKHILTPDVPYALYPIMIPIEIVGMLTKPFALMVRLFANITAGHIIILSLVGLIFIFETAAIAPVSIVFVLFMLVLKLLVALLQAYIFTLLAALFIGQAVEEAH